MAEWKNRSINAETWVGPFPLTITDGVITLNGQELSPDQVRETIAGLTEALEMIGEPVAGEEDGDSTCEPCDAIRLNHSEAIR